MQIYVFKYVLVVSLLFMCKLKVYTVTTMCFGAKVDFDFLTLLTNVVLTTKTGLYPVQK